MKLNSRRNYSDRFTSIIRTFVEGLCDMLSNNIGHQWYVVAPSYTEGRKPFKNQHFRKNRYRYRFEYN